MHDLFQRLLNFDYCQLGQWLFLIPAIVMLLAASATVAFRNLIHSALSLTLSFIALGILFIALGAEFVGFVQLLVYVGAVSILIVFAILLTRPDQIAKVKTPFSLPAIGGGFIAWLVLVGLCAAIASSPFIRSKANVPMPAAPEVTMVAIGEQLLTNFVLPLQATGILLTAALIGAALIAKEEKQS